jgi:UDP-N-acetylglucosamine 1-carboxyvinyltransferase
MTLKTDDACAMPHACDAFDVPGGKNVAMPAIALVAALRAKADLSNVPRIDDVAAMLSMLDAMGARHEWRTPNTLHLDATAIPEQEVLLVPVPANFRGAIYMCALGLTSRSGRYEIRVGGDKIATRSLRPHLRAVKGFGHQASVTAEGMFRFEPAPSTAPARFRLDDKGVSASCLSLILAACRAGKSRVGHISLEHEVADFVQILRDIGLQVYRKGRDVTVTSQPSQLRARVSPIVIPSDAVVAGTAMVSSIVRGDRVRLRMVGKQRRTRWIAGLGTVAGAPVEHVGSEIRVCGPARRAFDISTGFPPLLPADLQPLFTVMALSCPGHSRIQDRVYGTARFEHVPGLISAGARIRRASNTLQIGQSTLRGSIDGRRLGIREQAALRLAQSAHDIQVQGDMDSLWRGYERETPLTNYIFGNE